MIGPTVEIHSTLSPTIAAPTPTPARTPGTLFWLLVLYAVGAWLLTRERY